MSQQGNSDQKGQARGIILGIGFKIKFVISCKKGSIQLFSLELIFCEVFPSVRLLVSHFEGNKISEVKLFKNNQKFSTLKQLCIGLHGDILKLL